MKVLEEPKPIGGKAERAIVEKKIELFTPTRIVSILPKFVNADLPKRMPSIAPPQTADQKRITVLVCVGWEERGC